jgi:lysophospholipase L1-like esterase
VLGGLALGWTVSDAAAGPGVQARTRDPVHEDFAGPRTLAGLAHFQHPVLRRSDTWLKDHRFRDRRFTLEKPAGTARVVCIGSSSTWGHAILPETGGDYPAALERALRARNPDLQVEVLNGAIRGGTTARLNVFLREVLLEFDPDVVTASWFFNDAVSGSQYDEGEFFARIAADDYHHGPWQRRQVQRATRAGADALSRLFSRFGAEGTDCVAAWREILGDPDAETPLDRFTANLRSTAELCRERGVRLILIKEPLRGDVPWIWKQEFYRAIDAVGAEFGVPVVDPGPPLRSIGTASLFMDVVHPLPAGNEVIAETLAPFVEDALSAR